MNKQIMCLLSFILALGMVSTGYGTTVAVSDFEGGLDGWAADGAMISLSTTTGSQAMLVEAGSGWVNAAKRDAKSLMEALGHKGVTITADVTAYPTDMAIPGYFQAVMVINGGGDIGWNNLDFVDVTVDGQTRTLTWTIPDSLADKIALADQSSIGYFEVFLISNADIATKFYIDNIQVSYPEPTASTVIGDFENSSLDNWGPAWEGSPVLANSTTGVTSGSGSLSLTTTGGYYCLQWNAPTIPESMAGQKLQFDLTMIASEWPVGLWTKVADKVALNSDGPSGWKEFTNATAIDALTGESTSTDWGRWWDTAPDVVKTYTVDISDYDLTGATWFQINISVQGGDGIGHFYFDNVQLVSPKPLDAPKSTDLVIGDWEHQMDGWVVGGGADVRYSDTNGVTLGNSSLDVFVETGAWNQNLLTLNLLDPNNAAILEAFKVNTKISVDVTRLLVDWPSGTDFGADQLGWNEILLILDYAGDGWATDWDAQTGSGNWSKQVSWLPRNGRDETVTATWDYSRFLPDIDFDTMTSCTIHIGINANDSDYTGWVWFYIDNMKLSGAGLPLYPQPVSGARDVPTDTTLSWKAGTFAATHHLYLGSDRDKVDGANMDSDPDVTFVVLDANNFDPNDLEFNTEYFWRVEEVNEANPDSPWTSPVWEFITADFVVVDDFEAYNDINPGEPGSNRIMESWTDGFEVETNGALVGHDFPPYAEWATVHSGTQAMPLFYDNTGAALQSETQRVWAEPQDWTWAIIGSNALKLYTHGSPQNAPAELYLIIEDSAGVSHKVTNPDSAIFTAEEWTEWELSLNEFTAAGVDLAAVKKLVIGIADLPGQAEASGILYIDDIRRYPPIVVSLDPDHVVVPKTSIAPIIDGLGDGPWNDVNETQCLITEMSNADSATPENANDLSATFKVMFDDNNFYIFVEVLDSIIDITHNDEWMNDGIEVYFDGDYSHGDTYDGVNDNQIRITVGDVALADTNSSLAIDGSIFKVLLTPLGYNIEASFPLDALQIYPSQDPEPALDADGVVIPGTGIALNNIIGFEVQINDNDGGGRETIMRWHSDDNNSYQDPSLFGQARLIPAPAGN